MSPKKSTPLENVQKMTLFLADAADDQADTNRHIIETLKELVVLLEKMEASNALLEARVQFLEATNG